jgi:AraC-like DNA-binding protein
VIYRERLPPPELRDYVERLWWLEGPPEEFVAEPIPPDGHAEIVVHGGEPFLETRPGGETLRQERALLAGQATRPVRVRPGGPVRTVGARLWPDAAHALFGSPQSEVTDRVVDLRDLDRRLAATLRGDVAARGGGESMLDALEGALSAAVSRRRRSDRPAAPAVRLALERGGLLRVDALARSIGVTRRQAERIFRDRVGLAPKLFLRIVRFQRALSALRSGSRPAWAELAVAHGFYDQAHFVRDFRDFAGVAPGGWSASEASLAALFSAVRRETEANGGDVAFVQDPALARS